MAGGENQKTMQNPKHGNVGKTAGTVYTPFFKLSPDSAAQIVKALVLNVWKFENKRFGKGTQMQAIMGKDHVQLIQEKVKEGCVYSIQRFSIAKPVIGYRIISFQYVMWLNMFAKIENLHDDPTTFPDELFNFLALGDVPNRKNDTTYYIAVLGKLKSISNIVNKTVGDGEVLMREIVIKNGRGDAVKVTLWDELVKEIDDDVEISIYF